MKNTILTIPVTILITMLSFAPSVAAQEESAADEVVTVDQPKIRNWSLRFGFVVAETDGSTSVFVDPGSVDVKLNGGGGGFVTLENKITPLFGLEFGSTGIGTDMNVSTQAGLKHIGTDVDVLSMGALTLGANFHFVRTGAINVYAGPMLAFNRYSKWRIHTGIDDDCWWPTKHDDHHWVSVESNTDSELTWGAKVGIDIVLNKRGNWTLGGSLSYLDATYNFKQDSEDRRGSIDLDPIMFSFGAGFRF